MGICRQLPQAPVAVALLPAETGTWNWEPDEPFSLKLLLLGCFIVVNTGEFPKSLSGDSNVKPVPAKY